MENKFHKRIISKNIELVLQSCVQILILQLENKQNKWRISISKMENHYTNGELIQVLLYCVLILKWRTNFKNGRAIFPKWRTNYTNGESIFILYYFYSNYWYRFSNWRTNLKWISIPKMENKVHKWSISKNIELVLQMENKS